MVSGVDGKVSMGGNGICFSANFCKCGGARCIKRRHDVLFLTDVILRKWDMADIASRNGFATDFSCRALAMCALLAV
jgi:hypothetical protein